MAMNKIIIAIAVFMHLIVAAVPAIRSWFMYKRAGFNVRLSALSELMVIVGGANAILPFRAAGIFIRTYVLKKMYSIPYKITLTVTAIEQMFDMIAQLMIIGICVYTIGVNTEVSLTMKIIICAIALLGLIIIFYWKGLSDLCCWIIGIVECFCPKKIINWISKKSKVQKSHIVEIIGVIQRKEGKAKTLACLVLTTLLIYAIFPIPFYLFVFGTGFTLSVTQIFVVFWLPMLLGRISGIPGGLGVREASMIFLLNNMGLSIGEATALTLSFRVLTIAVMVAGCLVLSTKYGLDIFRLHKIKKEEEVRS